MNPELLLEYIMNNYIKHCKEIDHDIQEVNWIKDESNPARAFVITRHFDENIDFNIVTVHNAGLTAT